MKNELIESLKKTLSDRVMVGLLALLILVALAFCVYVGISLRPSDLQVAVHYTAYGETNFYREKWYYLISFIIFGLVMAGMHTALAVKLYAQERRQMAVLFIWLSILVLVIAWALTYAVLKVAFL